MALGQVQAHLNLTRSRLMKLGWIELHLNLHLGSNPVLKQLEGVNRYVTNVESAIGDRLDNQEASLHTMDCHCSAFTATHNELTDSVSHLLQQVTNNKQYWDNLERLDSD